MKMHVSQFLHTEMEALSLYIHVTMKTHTPSESNITIINTDGTVTANLLQHEKEAHVHARTHTYTYVSIKWNVRKEHYKLQLPQACSKNCQTGCKVTVLQSLEFLYCTMVEYSLLNHLLLISKLKYVLFRSDTQWSKDTCSAITEFYVPTEWHTL